MGSSDQSGSPDQPYDPTFWQEMQRLHRLTAYGRWSVVGVLWLIVAPICVWHLREEFALWFDYFTWTAVRYTIAYNLIPSIGLTLCLAITIMVLLWQARYLLMGLSKHQTQYLEKQVLKIRKQGKSHPLWKWVCRRS